MIKWGIGFTPSACPEIVTTPFLQPRHDSRRPAASAAMAPAFRGWAERRECGGQGYCLTIEGDPPRRRLDWPLQETVPAEVTHYDGPRRSVGSLATAFNPFALMKPSSNRRARGHPTRSTHDLQYPKTVCDSGQPTRAAMQSLDQSACREPSRAWSGRIRSLLAS